MSDLEKIVHRFLIGFLFSIVTWLIVDLLIVDIKLYKYFIIEILMLVMLKISIEIQKKLGI